MEVSPYFKTLIPIYENSPIATMLMDKNLEPLWSNEAMKHLAFSVADTNILRYFPNQKELLAKLQNGEVVRAKTNSLSAHAAEILLHPCLENDVFSGAVLHFVAPQASEQPLADELVYQPVSVFSNQFRTPLSKIFSILHLMQDDENLSSSAQNGLRAINKACYQILHTVINFSEDSKILSKQVRPQMKNGDITRFVRELCEDIADLVSDEKRIFRFDLPNEPIFTAFDENILSHAILNLVSNAFKFSDPLGCEVHLRMRSCENQIHCTVRDSGYGMAPETLERAFNRFFSNHPLSGEPCGDGLGLFIARCSVEMHGGSIALDSKKDRGTTAAFQIPIHLESSESAFSDRPARYKSDRFSNLYVLLSDIYQPEI